MRFLIPREMKFFDMFDQVAVILIRASDKFLAMVTQFDRLAERSYELRQEERACDDLVEQIITALDQSFVTPFDREDIHNLTTKLDDVLDNMEETAHRFEIFRIEKPPSEAIVLARIIKDCCTHVADTLRLLRSMKNVEEIQKRLREIGRLENEADRVYRDCDGDLFANPPDILLLIKLRELYGWMEETVDACKDVALIISEIVIKGS
ncbi:MAG: DUF47 family protein [Planctomycetia bacterium]|nr:DUF47 family protein [Planctomycetia bacterium]